MFQKQGPNYCYLSRRNAVIAHNQTIGSSNLSGRANLIKHLTLLTEIESSYILQKSLYFFVHQDGNRRLGGCRRSFSNPGRFAYSSMTMSTTLPKAHTGVVQA